MSDLRNIEEYAHNLKTSVENIIREEIQKKVLHYLFVKDFFKEGVFQGGTALRLLYNNPRYSEDLDFVFTKYNSTTFKQVEKFFEGIEQSLKTSLDFIQNIEVQQQKSTDTIRRVNLKFTIKSIQKKLRLQCEFANIQACTFVARNLTPDTTIITETIGEILADKVVAVSLRDYVKGRDLWDIYYLVTQLNADISYKFITKKFSVYNCPISERTKKIISAVTRIENEGLWALQREMSKYMPGRTFETYKPLFPDAVKSVCEVLNNVSYGLSDTTTEEKFFKLSKENKNSNGKRLKF